MAENGEKVKGAAKKAVKGESSKDTKNKSPESGPPGGGDSEANLSAGSKVKT